VTTTDQTNKVEQRHMKRADELFNDVAVGVRYSAYKGAAVAYIAQAFASFEAEILAQHQADNGWCFNMEDAPEKEELFLHHPNWLAKIIIGYRGSDGCFYDRTNSHITNQPIAFKPILLPEQRELPE